MKTYTVWHQLWHIVKDNMTRKESWLRENITGFVYRKELAADTRCLFAVTAWNKWGESELEIDKILNISTKFTDAFTHQIERTTNLPGMNDCESQKWVACDDALSFMSVICFREEGMIHFFYNSHAKKPESGLLSDWIENNTVDLRRSDWPKRRQPLVVVDFSLHFCLGNEQ